VPARTDQIESARQAPTRRKAEEMAVATNTKWMPATPDELDAVVQHRIDGMASEEQIVYLDSHKDQWVASLWRLLDAAERRLDSAREEFRGPERSLVLADLDNECFRIDDAMTALVGPAAPDELTPEPPRPNKPVDVQTVPGTAQLQLSRTDGRIVAWAGGHNARPEAEAQVLERVKALDGGAIEWDEHGTLKLPVRGRAETVATPLTSAIGWLVALATTHDDDTVGASATWMGLAAVLAVDLVAQGRVIPQLVQSKRSRRDNDDGLVKCRVRWLPALIEPERLADLVASVPGAVMVNNRDQNPEKFTAAVIGDLTHAIVSTAAGQLTVPATPPEISNRADVGEAILCNLGGEPFFAPRSITGEIVRKLQQWASPVSGAAACRLVILLDPPDESDAWHVAVHAPGIDGGIEPVEVAVTTGSKSRSAEVGGQLSRLERLFPELLRLGGRRRGEVILSQDEAWRLMTTTGDVLTAAGYEVRVPPLSRKKATPSLRLTSQDAQDTVVGAQQLADVRWSAVFDDVELTAAEISKLAAEARPLVKSRGQWVEIDKADLVEAAAALAERADKTRLSGADMLRHALGLEGSPLSGGISLQGDGWAADLLASVESLPESPTTRPEGFEGELRSYQADALAWLNFLDDAGLGGCLALDMGLGKTPTLLANLLSEKADTPSLVIAPPAVVGNWASEARRFVPGLKVLVHHGASRAKESGFGRAAAAADLVITTYGTAVRDIEEIVGMKWWKVVLDEAQAIKNPAAETSRQLQRIEARTRVALTGTPIENGLGDLWAIMNWANPGLLGPRAAFIAQLTPDNKRKSDGEDALRALNGILVYRRTKAEPLIAAELPDRIDELDRCAMTEEQIGLYQAVIDTLVLDAETKEPGTPERKGAVLAAITALKQICNHPVNYQDDDVPLDGRSGKLARLNEIVENVYAAGEKVLVFTHFATWGVKLAEYLGERHGIPVECYHGGLTRGARDRMVEEFQGSEGPGAMVLSLKAGGTGLNLTAANHVVLYDRWWNPAVEDQARDRVWRIGQTNTVICHRLVCPGTVDERVEEVVAGKRHIADVTLPKSSSIGDLDATQLRQVFGIDESALIDLEQIDTESEVETP